jgi:4-hydroxy-4-methyl-2-oxoglutarate aldolase
MEPALTSEEFEALRRLETCTVANAIETFNVRLRNEGFANSRSVHSIFSNYPPMLGYAVTGTIRSTAPPLASSLPPPRILTFSHRSDWWDYILSIPAPRVVVLQDVDSSPGLGAFMGEVHSAICRAFGCTGYVTNGAVRDLNAIEPMGFSLFAGTVSVSHAYVHIVDYGEPVEIGGLRIRPGALIHGDRHGLQTIPNDIAARIPAVAARQVEEERQILDLCNSPDFSPGKLRKAVKEAEQRLSESKPDINARP